jgi:hypothetical protein
MTLTDWGHVAIILALIIAALLTLGCLLLLSDWLRGRRPQPPAAEAETWLRDLLEETVIDVPPWASSGPAPARSVTEAITAMQAEWDQQQGRRRG